MNGVCRYEVLDTSSQTLRGGAQDIARDLLEATLEVTAGLLSAEAAQLAPPLCQVLTTSRTDCNDMPHLYHPGSFPTDPCLRLLFVRGAALCWLGGNWSTHTADRQGAQCYNTTLQVIRVMVVRLQQQAVGWTSGSASHGTGEPPDGPPHI